MKIKKILIIDEDSDFQKELTSYLKKLHFSVSSIDLNLIKEYLAENELPDLIILDPLVPNLTIEQFIEQIKLSFKEVPFIVISNQNNYNVLIKAMLYGAIDYIEKPTNLYKLQVMVHRIASQSSMVVQIRAAQGLYNELMDVYEQQMKLPIVSASPEMLRIVDTMSMAASQDNINILIQGEKGVGKESIARGIHSISKRRNGTFMKFDPASVPPLLLESELYGHSRNAFTGMMEEKTGILEAAKGGIIFLDEITGLSLPIQEKLVHTIKSGKFKKLRSDKSITLDVRFISSTHMDLDKQISKGIFHKELLDLVNQYEIDIPPLRERKEDIILLAKHFVSMYASIMQRSAPEIEPDVVKLLLTYTFPNNIRELKNLIRKAMILSEKNNAILHMEDFPDLYIDRPKSSADSNWQTVFQPLDILDKTEKQWLINALKFYHNNKTHVARALHITRQSLNRRIEKHGIQTFED